MKVMHTHQGKVHIGASYQITSSYMGGRGRRPTTKQRKLYRSTWHHLNHHLHKGDFTTDDINQYLESMSIMEEYECVPLWVPMVKRYMPAI